MTSTPSPTSYYDAIWAEGSLLNYFRMDDSTGTAIDDLETANNNGTYFGSPTKSQAGAIAGNNAVLFDGVDDYGSIARQVSADFSVEFWFKSTQGLGTTGGWQSYAGLVDNNVTGSNNDWGISLSADGHVMAGIGGGTGGGADATISSLAGGWDDNNWHHVVLTRTQSSGAYALYIDGGTPVTGTNNTALLNGREHRLRADRLRRQLLPGQPRRDRDLQ